jgi:hypothetical protein
LSNHLLVSFLIQAFAHTHLLIAHFLSP